VGYAIEALIGGAEVLEPLTAAYRNARIVPLTEELAMIPMVEILRNAIQRQNHDPEREPNWPFWHLSPEGAMTVAETCERGALVYVEARFYAGVGVQASVGWRDGALRHGPLSAKDAINQALRFLGVVSAEDKDEFDTVGLGRHRLTDMWGRG
jgi:hypothetical protein